MRGAALSQKVRQAFGENYDCVLYTKYKNNTDTGIQEVKGSVADWAADCFFRREALLFIGACGIAVRAIAPCIKDKLQDGPVLVMDEAGTYVIPILSGHYGGANAIAQLLSDRIGAQAVITTATDVNHLFAADVFAAKNNLIIHEREKIARVSAKILDTGEITMAIAGEYTGSVPKEVRLLPYSFHRQADVLVSASFPPETPQNGFGAGLHLIPRELVLGMGCRKQKSPQEIEEFVIEMLKEHQIPIAAIDTLATIEQKKDEEGLLLFAEKYRLKFVYFTGEQLGRARGNFTGSSFVKKQVGVDNVCERAAVTAAGDGGRLLLCKTVANGMTMAVAEKHWKVSFEN